MTFADTADAVAASTEMIDSKMGKSLKKFLTKNIIKKELKDKVGAMGLKVVGFDIGAGSFFDGGREAVRVMGSDITAGHFFFGGEGYGGSRSC